MSNINTFRKHLFDTMEDLRAGRMSAANANAIASTGQVIINSLKLELDARKLAGVKQLTPFIAGETLDSSDQLSLEEKEIAAKELDDLLPAYNPTPVGITRHYMHGDSSDE